MKKLDVNALLQKSNYSVTAVIREAECIGCTKCIQACPFDSIIGAAKLMHTVITDACTGCELCIPPCPVDCIDLVPRNNMSEKNKHEFIANARERFEKHAIRVENDKIIDRQKHLQAKQAGERAKSLDARRAEISAALKRLKKS